MLQLNLINKFELLKFGIFLVPITVSYASHSYSLLENKRPQKIFVFLKTNMFKFF